MGRGAAHLPDARVGLSPDAANQVGGIRKPAGRVGVEAAAGSLIQPRGLHVVAVDIELALRKCLVADPYRSRVAISGQCKRFLARVGAAIEAVEDLQPGMCQLGGVKQPPEERVGLVRATDV